MRLRHNAARGLELPELPEVETVRRGLIPHLEGRVIARAEARRPDLRWPLPVDLVQVLTGARVTALRRRSKYLLLDLDRGGVLLMHLGMSGRLLVEGAGLAGFHRDPSILSRHDHVVLTQDWHPADHSSFADNHPGAEPFSTVQMDYGPQVLWPAHCVIGSAGAAFHPGLAADRADLIVRKGFRAGIDSYSAFFENDRTTATGLAGYLRDRGITDLTLVGLAHDFCVAWSAMDAARLGFAARVAEDACRAIDLDGSLAAARAAMRQAGVTLA